jgi:hypothetical protein
MGSIPGRQPHEWQAAALRRWIGTSKPCAMCLYPIDRKNASSLQTLYRECTGAIECGKCPAIALSDEESSSRL